MNEQMDIKEKIGQIPYWYHKIKLPDGTETPGLAMLYPEKYGVPADLTGKKVLDIGAWDGYWTFEALKRGARQVIAIDDFSDSLGYSKQRPHWETFDLCREAFGFTKKVSGTDCAWRNKKGQLCRRKEMSVYDIKTLGTFDVVFFFGTIYHLKHPLLALEKISAVCDGELYIESAICDDYSPYRGGLNRGYHNNDMVSEFYPSSEYGKNDSNWWVPTLQCLGYMAQSAGFETIEMWRLTENPQIAGQCRGFVYAGKDKSVPENVKKQAYTDKVLKKRSDVRAVMSVPRLGFQDNFFSIYDTLVPLKIPLLKVEGVFWGQSLESAMQTQIDAGAEVILVIDYDTLFKKEDLQELLELLNEHPEADAIVPLQVGRMGKGALCTVRTKTGQWLKEVPREMFKPELLEIATGHFGLTLIRASALMKMPHPWFFAEPDKDGQWGRDRTDADIYFWRQLKRSGGRAFLANRVVIGHLELVATWPDANMSHLHQIPKEFYLTGKPKTVWK